MHACYACGALLCPFLISAAARVSTTLAVLALAALGLVLWLVYLFTPMAGRAKAKEAVTDWNFLRSSRFWLLTGLLFCQNAPEQSVVGWMVTYFKDSGIIAGTLAAYTVTVMWGATLIGRLLIAFVFPLQQPRKAMGAVCRVAADKDGAGVQDTALGNAYNEEGQRQQNGQAGQAHQAVAHRHSRWSAAGRLASCPFFPPAHRPAGPPAGCRCSAGRAGCRSCRRQSRILPAAG